MLLEPASPESHSLLHRFGDEVPPVVCLSVYPREAGLAPPESVAYLVKPSSTAALGDALRSVSGADAPASFGGLTTMRSVLAVKRHLARSQRRLVRSLPSPACSARGR